MSHGTADHLHGVLLAGGSGTRLWPLSVKSRPKQFLPLSERGSLISQTAERLKGLVTSDHLWAVCGKNHIENLKRHVSEIPLSNILIEPQAKNTAPALALAAVQIAARDPEAVMIVLPADHWIPEEDQAIFVKNLSCAIRVATDKKALVTLGIPPQTPATGFGYMERGEALEIKEGSCFKVRAFHEKPDATTAEDYLEKGGYFWNSGIFVWTADVFLKELKRFQPEMAEKFAKLAEKIASPEFPDLLAKIFAEVENISVDYALMEKAETVLMVPAQFAWDDVGGLASLSQILEVDKNGNHFQGEVYALNSKENLVMAETRPVSLIGVENMIVVEANGAVLVLPKDRAQEVRDLVQYLKKLGKEDLL